jgi:hypothetical protein
MNPFNSLFDGIDAGVEALFSINNIALWFASGLLAWCAWIILANYRRHYAPFSGQLSDRLEVTRFITEAEDDGEARRAFAVAFAQVDAAMSAGGPGGTGLRHAWRQYRATLLDLDARDDALLRATARPEDYFLHLGDETRVLAWWANIFVAIGLTFTFLGIVAALLKAVQAMGASADPANMQVALVALLHITAAKFWTSIGGVLSSIILRVFDRRWHASIDRRLQALCDRIEAGTLLVSPQFLAAEQLAEMRRQNDLLAGRAPASAAVPAGGGALAPETGEQLSDAARAFAVATDRLAATLDGLDARVGAMTGRIVAEASEGVGAALGSAIKRSTAATDAQAETLTAASDEVKSLLATLGRVVGEMSAVFAPLRTATVSIERSVLATQDMLNVAGRRTEQGEAALKATTESLEETSRAAARAWDGYRERFEAVDVSLAAALERIGGASAEHAGALTEQVGRIDRALAQAVDRLAGALETIGDLTAVLDDMRGDLRAKR